MICLIITPRVQGSVTNKHILWSLSIYNSISWNNRLFTPYKEKQCEVDCLVNWSLVWFSDSQDKEHLTVATWIITSEITGHRSGIRMNRFTYMLWQYCRFYIVKAGKVCAEFGDWFNKESFGKSVYQMHQIRINYFQLRHLHCLK